MHAFVTRQLPGDALARLDGVCSLDVWEDDAPPPAEVLRERAREADGLLCLLTDRIDEQLLDACPRLKVVSQMAVGVDNVDLAACARRGIPVGNTPDVLTDATADLAMALLLAAARRLPEGMAAVGSGAWGPWRPSWLLGLELRGARLGIVGMGRIGRAVAERARAFGMDVVHAARSGTVPPPADAAALPFAELLRTSDVVSLHCPLTPATKGLIDAEALATMKPGALLVNTARGPVVDQDALADALHAGRLGGAALDVTDPEPLPPDHPLLSAPNLIVLPHLGSATHATRERMAELAVENLAAGLAGRPLPHAVA
jgi:lactate dehydrogenase-like 2-hydroxyacid dehydrogenase